jgi:hypothetical protein
MKTAYATIKGIEVMRCLKKGQGSIYRILDKYYRRSASCGAMLQYWQMRSSRCNGYAC